MMTYGVVKTKLQVFLISTLETSEWSASHYGRFIPDGRALGTHCIGGWFVTEPAWTRWRREKSLPLPGISNRASLYSQSLYWLSNPDLSSGYGNILLEKGVQTLSIIFKFVKPVAWRGEKKKKNNNKKLGKRRLKRGSQTRCYTSFEIAHRSKLICMLLTVFS